MAEENSFGEMLKRDRIRMGWTQQELADKLRDTSFAAYVPAEKASRLAITRWEGGLHFPSRRKLKRLMAVLGLDQEGADTYSRAVGQAPPEIICVPETVPPPPEQIQHPPPEIFHVPPLLSRFFTGREGYLDELRKLLQEEGIVSITGLGGLGKSQVALKYAHRYHPDTYRAVLWVNAADTEMLQRDYKRIARRLGLPEGNENDPELYVEAVKRWLQMHTKWLLIMDNADDLPIVRPFLVARPPGHIILTTRWQSDDKLAKPLAIEAMRPEEGLRFLLRRTGRLQKEAEPDEEAEPGAVAADIREPVAKLVVLLGGHALALEQAGAYMRESQTSFAGYLGLYEASRRILLDQYGALGGVNSEHPLTVAATFRTSLAKARELCPMAEDILYFCAFLHPDAIPEELFQHSDRFRLDVLTFRKGIAALLRYSLIKLNNQEKTLSMHRLVQAVLIDTMPLDLQKHWRQRMVWALDAAFPGDPDSMDWSLYWSRGERLLSHALVCADWTDNELPQTLGAALLFQKAGLYLFVRGQHSDAERLLVHTLSLWNLYVGKNNDDSITIMQLLALIYQYQGVDIKAKSLYERAYTIFRELLDDKRSDTGKLVRILVVLDLLHVTDGLLEPLFCKALKRVENDFGDKHPRTAATLEYLAGFYLRQHKYELAEPLYLRALAIHKCLVSSYRSRANIMHGLADLYWSQGKLEDAQACCEQALAFRERHLGTNHPYTARSLSALARLLQNQGKYEQVESLYRRALNIQEHQLGVTHPDTQHTKRFYAKFLHSIGRDTEAAALDVNYEPPV